MIVSVRERRHGEQITPRALSRHSVNCGNGTVADANANRVNAAIAIGENRAADDDLRNTLFHAPTSVVMVTDL
jgi:hypothetical protein